MTRFCGNVQTAPRLDQSVRSRKEFPSGIQNNVRPFTYLPNHRARATNNAIGVILP